MVGIIYFRRISCQWDYIVSIREWVSERGRSCLFHHIFFRTDLYLVAKSLINRSGHGTGTTPQLFVCCLSSQLGKKSTMVSAMCCTCSNLVIDIYTIYLYIVVEFICPYSIYLIDSVSFPFVMLVSPPYFGTVLNQ